MLMAIAIGRLYQTVNSAISGMGAPKAVFRPIDTNETASGTASAIAYQIQLTRQRINRDPIARSPATPSVKNTTISAATRTPGAKKLCHGMAPQLRAQARMKKVTTGCRRTIDTRGPPVLRSLLTSSYDRRRGHKALAGRPPKTQGGFLPCHRELSPVTVRCLGSRAASGLARARSTVLSQSVSASSGVSLTAGLRSQARSIPACGVHGCTDRRAGEFSAEIRTSTRLMCFSSDLA